MSNVFEKYQPGAQRPTTQTSPGVSNVFSQYQRAEPVREQVQITPVEKPTFGQKVKGAFQTAKTKVTEAFKKGEEQDVTQAIAQDILNDKQKKLQRELSKPSPRNKVVEKLNKEIEEVQLALDSNSMGARVMVGHKYGNQKTTDNIKAGFVSGFKNMLDGIAQLFEVQFQNERDFADKQEEIIKQGFKDLNIPEEEQQAYLEKYSPRYQPRSLTERETLAEREKEIQKAKDEGREGFKKVLETYVEDASPADPSFIDQLEQGVGSMGFFYVATILTGGGSVIPTVTESLGESGAVYEENKANGMSPKEAFEGSAKNFVANLVWNTVLNKFSGLFDNLDQPATKELKEKIIDTVRGGTFEGIQEAGQQLRSNIDTGKEDIWEGVFESLGIGAIIGAGAGGITSSVTLDSSQESVQENVFEKHQTEESLEQQTITPDERVTAPEELSPTEALEQLRQPVETTPGAQEAILQERKAQQEFVDDAIDNLIVESRDVPVQEGFKRFYQLTGETETPWLWGSIKEMRSWAETSMNQNETLRFVDLKPDQVTQNRNGAFVAKEGALPSVSTTKETVSPEVVREQNLKQLRDTYKQYEKYLKDDAIIKAVKKYDTAEEFARVEGHVLVSPFSNRIEIMKLFPKDSVRGKGIITKQVLYEIGYAHKRTGYKKVYSDGFSKEGDVFNKSLVTKGYLKDAVYGKNRNGEETFTAYITNKLIDEAPTTSPLEEIYKAVKNEVVKPKEQPKKPVEAVVAPPAKSTAEPVGTGKKKPSRFQERIGETLLNNDPTRYELDPETGNYNTLNLQEDAKKAVDYLENNPEDAIAVSLGLKETPPGQTTNGISIATALKAMDEGNYSLFAEIINSTSLRNTRLGQEIVSLRGSFSEDTPQNYISRVIDTRMKNLASRLVSKAEQKGKSYKEIVTRKIDEDVKKVKKELSKEQVKIKKAQDIIDALRC